MAEKVDKKTVKRVIKRTVRRLNEADQTVFVKVQSTDADTQKTDAKPKKVCYFHQSKTSPLYTDVNTLRKFLTDRGKIVPKMRSGLCSKHQRNVTAQINYARFIGLLPFTPKV